MKHHVNTTFGMLREGDLWLTDGGSTVTVSSRRDNGDGTVTVWSTDFNRYTRDKLFRVSAQLFP